MEIEKLIGKVVDIKMKPTFKRGWKIVADTGNCIKIEKLTDSNKRWNLKPSHYHIPKKNILDIFNLKDDKDIERLFNEQSNGSLIEEEK